MIDRKKDRRYEYLKLVNSGFKPHEIVKDSKGYPRIRVEIKKRLKK